jgi:RNA polymerase sigma factor (sigma-70 family)
METYEQFLMSLIRHYHPPILSSVRGLCAKQGLGYHDTQDVCSEALLGLINAITTSDQWSFDPAHFERFLTTSALGFAKNAINKLSRKGITFMDASEFPEFSSLDTVYERDPAPMPDDYVANKIDLEAMLSVVDDQTGKILVLHHCEGLPFRDIAEKMGISKSRVSRLEHAGIVTILQHFRPNHKKNATKPDKMGV